MSAQSLAERIERIADRWDGIKPTSTELRAIAAEVRRLEGRFAQVAEVERERNALLTKREVHLHGIAHEQASYETPSMDWTNEDPGTCARCEEPFEFVRPGKSQPTCACWEPPQYTPPGPIGEHDLD